MYTLKSIARRGTPLAAVFAIVAATLMPAAAAFADSLNPLTERSLLLSSSAPGFQDTDGSNYSTAAPNPAAGPGIPGTLAPAGSGPNGKKSGETFTFKTTSPSAATKGFSLQYCTGAAGFCQAPGNNTGDARTLDDENTSNPGYDANDSSTWATRVSDRESNATAHPNGRSDFDVVGAPGTDWNEYSGTGSTAGTYEVKIGGVLQSGWTMTKANLESPYYQQADASKDNLTGKNNYITLTKPGATTITGGTQVQIIFHPSETAYITNPGSDAFFVKINTYSSDTNLIGSQNDATPLDSSDTPGHTVLDGGVTVANVMTDSIHITTKVLETMAFSVGTRNRDTVDIGGAGQTHGTCDPIQVVDNNRLNLGNPSAEYSLETRKAWDVNSYWRLSSNSSGGATVYYSGNTLANTVGDEIADMPSEVTSLPGTEQFGLGFVDAGTDSGQDALDTNPAVTWADGSKAAHLAKLRSYPFITLSSQGSTAPYNALQAQSLSTGYDEATGSIDDGNGGAGTAKFQFHKSSSTVPEPIAQQNETVISCATAKMRYVGNIAADTPAGVYTTKINYLAAPQY